MSPLETAPNRGYADWQRLDNWDSGVLASVPATVTNLPQGIGVLDVSRYAYLGGWVQPGTGPSYLTLNWFADAAQQILLGSRTIVFDPNAGGYKQFRLLNLGPFLSGSFSPIAGNYSADSVFIGTNRYSPLEFIPRGAVLINQHGINIAANNNQAFYPADYYAGPITLEVFSTVAGVQFELDALGTDNSWVGAVVLSPAANVWTIQTVAAPVGAWRVTAFMGATGGPVWVFAIPSVTGAI